MKNFIALLVSAILFAGCAAHKKAVKETTTAVDSSSMTEQVTDKTTNVVDTSRSEHGEVIITDITFFAPGDSGAADIPETEIELPGVGKVKGAVARVRQTQIRKDTDVHGKGEKTETHDESKSNANLSSRHKDVDKQSEPTADPYRWRYIAFIVAALIAVLIAVWVKKRPILDKLAKIFQRIRAFL